VVGILRGIKELVEILLLWGFIYFGTIILMIVLIIYLIQTNSSPITSVEPTKMTWTEPVRVLETSSICKRVDGCPIVEGVCEDCVDEKNWVVKHFQ
jgi:hypothetical protein